MNTEQRGVVYNQRSYFSGTLHPFNKSLIKTAMLALLLVSCTNSHSAKIVYLEDTGMEETIYEARAIRNYTLKDYNYSCLFIKTRLDYEGYGGIEEFDEPKRVYKVFDITNGCNNCTFDKERYSYFWFEDYFNYYMEECI